ncbi:DUF397 domain-containing protein [Nonomuraea sp. NPDC050227]
MASPRPAGPYETQNPDGPALALTVGAWRAFIRAVKEGEFD